jgi:hypothetical protein
VISEALEPDPSLRIPTAEAFRKRLLAAAADVGGAAEVSEVAAYVEERVRPALEERRVRVAEVLRLRAQVGLLAQVPVDAPSPPSAGPALSEPRTSPPEPTMEIASGKPSGDERRLDREPRRAWPYALSLGLAVAVVGSTLVRARLGQSTSPPSVPQPVEAGTTSMPEDTPVSASPPHVPSAPTETPHPATDAPPQSPVRRVVTPRRPPPSLATARPPSTGRPPPLKNPFDDTAP